MKETYMVVDTDYNTTDFTNLKEAEEYYMKKVEEVVKNSTIFDGDIKFLVVTDSFNWKNLEAYQETTMEIINEKFSFNQPTEAK